MEKKRVLFIDDDACVQESIRRALSARGYDVAVVPDGRSGLDAAGRERPDVVLLDLGLPDGHGFAIVHQLRDLSAMAGVPIIAMGGCRADTYGPRALTVGACCYLEKPAPVTMVLDAIERACDAPAARFGDCC